ncbi:DUF3043 domain-containing protein [Leucobacter sp. GX24907]
MAKKNSADANQDEAPESIGKGRPTPKRKDAQAAKAQPLVGSRDKSALKAERAKQAQARERARLGMMAGDERFLTARDRGPQRRFVRDYVDARWNVGELLIPMMLVMLLVSLIPGPLAQISILVIWAFLALAILDAVILGIRLRGLLTQRFGADKLQGGFRWYAAMRALQFRMLRLPKPQVKRGQYPHRQR